MAKGPRKAETGEAGSPRTGRASAVVDTRIIYCGGCLEQLRPPRGGPDGCIDLIYISQIRRGGDPPESSNRNDEVFWGESKESRRAGIEDRQTSTQPYPDSSGRPRCVDDKRVELLNYAQAVLGGN